MITTAVYILHQCVIQDPADFQAAFDELVDYTSSAENWKQIKEELTDRGVSNIVAWLYVILT